MSEQALRDRIDELEEERRQLYALLLPSMLFPPHLQFTAKEEKVCAAILAGAPAAVSKDRIWCAVWGRGDFKDRKVMDVVICGLRRKLAPHGVTIHSKYKLGVWFDAESAAIVRKMIEGGAP